MMSKSIKKFSQNFQSCNCVSKCLGFRLKAKLQERDTKEEMLNKEIEDRDVVIKQLRMENEVMSRKLAEAQAKDVSSREAKTTF